MRAYLRQTLAKYWGRAREHLSDLRHCVATPCYSDYELSEWLDMITRTYLDVAEATGRVKDMISTSRARLG